MSTKLVYHTMKIVGLNLEIQMCEPYKTGGFTLTVTPDMYSPNGFGEFVGQWAAKVATEKARVQEIDQLKRRLAVLEAKEEESA